VKHAWIAVLGVLCADLRAEEAGYPAVRVGDSWEYSGHQQKGSLRRRPLRFRIDIEGVNPSGDLVAIHRDPSIDSDGQIGQVLDPVPAGGCVRDIMAGLDVLVPSQCATPPGKGARWSRELSLAGGRRIRFDFRYAGRERVRVPAGRFAAHRFEVDQQVIAGTTQIRLRRRYWYAPEVRTLVLMESETVDVLGRRGNRVFAELRSLTLAE
jgi:hypothetical protein